MMSPCWATCYWWLVSSRSRKGLPRGIVASSTPGQKAANPSTICTCTCSEAASWSGLRDSSPDTLHVERTKRAVTLCVTALANPESVNGVNVTACEP